ncbi:unnamed protein product [Arabidopsis thaliana]|uniref:Nudix hydrolase n=1 Tax=Arabidopsis thaliana TaxID=3702 RepID=A0A654ET79_ARATH|nr:unnamed protein product [Arabidopsis thaliana]
MDSEAQQISLLIGKEDRYGRVEVNLMEVEPMNAEDFNAKLDVSFKAWKDQGKKGIWIKLPCELSSLVDIAIKKGFTYHHAENEYAVLTSWISDLPNTIPANASHRIGIGALVLNKNREVLVVQEIDGVFKDTGLWKLPTGVIQENRENFRYMANICLKRSQEKEYLDFSNVLTKNSTGKESYLYCSTDHAYFLKGKPDHSSTSLFTTLLRKCFSI